MWWPLHRARVYGSRAAGLCSTRRTNERTAEDEGDAADVDTVVVSGRTVVSEGRRVLGDVEALLHEAREPLLGGT